MGVDLALLYSAPLSSLALLITAQHGRLGSQQRDIPNRLPKAMVMPPTRCDGLARCGLGVRPLQCGREGERGWPGLGEHIEQSTDISKHATAGR